MRTGYSKACVSVRLWHRITNYFTSLVKCTESNFRERIYINLLNQNNKIIRRRAGITSYRRSFLQRRFGKLRQEIVVIDNLVHIIGRHMLFRLFGNTKHVSESRFYA